MLTIHIHNPQITDYWEKEVPDDVRLKYPTVEIALDSLENDHTSVESALSLFYLSYDYSSRLTINKKTQKRINHLEQEIRIELLKELKLAIRVSGIVNKKKLNRAKFSVYIHLAGTVLVLLQDKDSSLKVKYDTILDTMENKLYKYFTNVTLDADFSKSVELVLSDLNARLFNTFYEQEKWEDAFISLGTGVELARNSGRKYSFLKNALDASRDDAGLAVTNCFLQLYENPGQVKDWSNITKICKVIWDSEIFNDEGVVTDDNLKKLLGEDWQMASNGGHNFWLMAIGLSLGGKKLKEIIQELEPQISDRLRHDYFSTIWDVLEPGSSQLLAEMETAWLRSNYGVMADNMRQLLEVEILSTFKFLRYTRILTDSHMIITRIRLAISNNKEIGNTINTLGIGTTDKTWVLTTVPSFLKEVTHVRNYFNKESHLPNKKDLIKEYEQKAINIHAQLLGIEYQSFLKRLLQIKSQVNG